MDSVAPIDKNPEVAIALPKLTGAISALADRIAKRPIGIPHSDLGSISCHAGVEAPTTIARHGIAWVRPASGAVTSQHDAGFAENQPARRRVLVPQLHINLGAIPERATLAWSSISVSK